MTVPRTKVVAVAIAQWSLVDTVLVHSAWARTFAARLLPRICQIVRSRPCLPPLAVVTELLLLLLARSLDGKDTERIALLAGGPERKVDEAAGGAWLSHAHPAILGILLVIITSSLKCRNVSHNTRSTGPF